MVVERGGRRVQVQVRRRDHPDERLPPGVRKRWTRHRARPDVDRHLPPQRQQPHRTRAHQPQRVQVRRTAQPAPVQAGPREAVRAWQLQDPDPVTGTHRVAHGHAGAHRLVGGAGVAVVDHDHTTPRDRAGEGDGARQRRAHRLAHGAEQVHASVTRPPGRGGRVEAGDDLGHRVQRPHAHRIRIPGRAQRRACPGQGQRDAQDDDEDEPGEPGPVGGDGDGAGRHASSLPAAGAGRAAYRPGWGQPARREPLCRVAGPPAR